MLATDEMSIECFIFEVYETVREWWTNHFGLRNLSEWIEEVEGLEEHFRSLPEKDTNNWRKIDNREIAAEALIYKLEPRFCEDCQSLVLENDYSDCDHKHQHEAGIYDCREALGENIGESIVSFGIEEEFLYLSRKGYILDILGRFGDGVFRDVTSWLLRFDKALLSQEGEEIMSELMAGLSLMHHNGELVSEHSYDLKDMIDAIRANGPAEVWGRQAYLKFVTSDININVDPIDPDHLREVVQFVDDNY